MREIYTHKRERERTVFSKRESKEHTQQKRESDRKIYTVEKRYKTKSKTRIKQKENMI